MFLDISKLDSHPISSDIVALTAASYKHPSKTELLVDVDLLIYCRLICPKQKVHHGLNLSCYNSNQIQKVL